MNWLEIWLKDFWGKYGNGAVFGLTATIFGIAFYHMEGMTGEAKALLLGVAMSAINMMKENHK